MAYSWVLYNNELILLDSEVSILFNISALPRFFLAAVVHWLCMHYFETSIIMEASTFLWGGGGGGGGGGGSWELARWG